MEYQTCPKCKGLNSKKFEKCQCVVQNIPDSKCSSCKGTGKVSCNTCDGSGRVHKPGNRP